MNTSISLHFFIENEISNLSIKSGVSKSEIVKVLISLIDKFNSIEEVEGVLVEYQSHVAFRDLSENRKLMYEIVHFHTDSKMISFTKKMRYLYGISLSKLVTASFLFFWRDVVRRCLGVIDEKLSDNYEKITTFFYTLKEYFKERLNHKEEKEIKLE